MKQAGNLNESSGLAIELQLGPFRVSGEKPTQVLANIHKWVEAEGQNFHFYGKGIVQVILDETVLEQSGLFPEMNSTIVLNLENRDLVRLSNEHSGQVRWFCQRDPRELVGPMLDHYRGTYYKKHLNQLVYSGDHDLEVYDLPQGLELDSSLLAAVCAAREAGIRTETIRKQLKEATNRLTRVQAGASSSSIAHSHF